MRVILLSIFAIVISAMNPNGDEEERSMQSDTKCGLFGCVKNRFGATAALAEAKQVLRDAQLQADDLISKAKVEAASTMSQASNQVLHLRSEIKQLQEVAERIRSVESAKAKSKTGSPICVRWEKGSNFEKTDDYYLGNGYEPFASAGYHGDYTLYRKCVSYA
ncbi:hypothetical protein MIR68_008992 [Amoeboaphelidium protococcarum]|nr:hypothetical protein MIR68_008992 [Amoeboaphelidium protococcarum]KAI3648689.1 hypothetical protein MP228_006543 [Amoeboaphelidium protococcarum]